jgi:hypothetical protein
MVLTGSDYKVGNMARVLEDTVLVKDFNRKLSGDPETIEDFAISAQRRRHLIGDAKIIVIAFPHMYNSRAAIVDPAKALFDNPDPAMALGVAAFSLPVESYSDFCA